MHFRALTGNTVDALFEKRYLPRLLRCGAARRAIRFSLQTECGSRYAHIDIDDRTSGE